MYQKKELVRKIAKNSEKDIKLTIKESTLIFDLVIKSIMDCIEESEDGVEIRNFLTFYKVDATRLTYKDPRNGVEVVKEPHKKIKVKINKGIKNLIK